MTTDPNVTAIQADGWRATYTSPPTEFDPVGDPKYVDVERPGFTAAGGTTTVIENLLLMKRVRQPYPNHTTLTVNDVALQDFVFSGDTISGVTNNSTVAYHKPICMWLDHDLRRVTDQSYTAKLAVAHWAARSGRPVAAVKFIATDGTNSVEQIVSTMTKTDYATSGLSVPHFEANLDLSSLNDDSLITIDAVIYPWVGSAAFQASVDFATYPSINFCEMKVFNAVTSAEATIYAYVDGVGAGTPTASTTEATALANPFATVAAAASAIQTLDGADVSRGLIRINAGVTVTHSSFSARAIGNTPLIIEGVNKTTSIYRDSGSSVSNGCADRVKFKHLTLKRNASGNVIFLDSSAGASTSNMMVFDDVVFDANGNSSFWAAWLYRIGLSWFINCSADATEMLSVFSTANKSANLIGSLNVNSGSANAIYNLAGNRSDDVVQSILVGGSRPAFSGTFIGFNFFTGSSATSPLLEHGEDVVGPNGLAIVGNIFERTSGAQPLLKISGDGVVSPAENIIIHSNTGVGERLNILYNDTGTTAVAKSGTMKFNAAYKFNTKTDTFNDPTDGPQGGRVGNWSFTHKVGALANAILNGSSDGSTTYGPTSWLGEVGEIGSVIGTDALPVDPDWVDDASAAGSGLGGGDYTPGASTELPNIPSGLSPYAFDLFGRTVADDGSAYAGAVQKESSGTSYPGSSTGLRSSSGVGSASATFEATFAGTSTGLRAASHVGTGTAEAPGAFTGAAPGIRAVSRTGNAPGTFTGSFAGSASGLRAAARIGASVGVLAGSFPGTPTGLRAASRVGTGTAASEGGSVGSAPGIRSAARVGAGTGVFVGEGSGTAPGIRAGARVGSGAGSFTAVFPGAASGLRAQTRVGSGTASASANVVGAASGLRAGARVGSSGAVFAGTLVGASTGIRANSLVGTAHASFGNVEDQSSILVAGSWRSVAIAGVWRDINQAGKWASHSAKGVWK